MIDLDGRVAIVSGANKGIGLEIAVALGRAGARVAVWGRTEATNQAAEAALSSLGVRGLVLKCDARDTDLVARSIQTVIDEFGRLDTMIANVGGGARPTPFVELSLHDWESVIATNLTATFISFREAARRMVVQGEGGSLVAIGSLVGSHGFPELAHYSAGKAALMGLVRSIATELGPHRI